MYGVDPSAFSSGDYRDGEDDASQLVPVRFFLERGVPAAPGVFAVHDERQALQFVSYSDDLSRALSEIQSRIDPESCAWCRVMIFRNKAMRTPDAMQVGRAWRRA